MVHDTYKTKVGAPDEFDFILVFRDFVSKLPLRPELADNHAAESSVESSLEVAYDVHPPDSEGVKR
jgi:hypothetical protein